MATILEADEAKYNNIGFATLPSPSNATGLTNAQNIGMGYGVAINAKLADDPEKLAGTYSQCLYHWLLLCFTAFSSGKAVLLKHLLD